MRPLKHVLKIIVKVLGGIFLVVCMLLLVGIAVFFAAPKITITGAQLRYLAKRFAPEYIKIFWDDASLRIVKSGFFSKNISVDLEKICVRYKGEALNICFDQFSWGAGLSVSGFNPRFTSFPPLIATKGQIDGDLNLLENKNNQSSQTNGFDVLAFLRKTLMPNWRWNGSKLEIISLNLKTGAQRIYASLNLRTAEENNGPLLNSDLMVFVPGQARANATLTLRPPSENKNRFYKMLGKVDAEMPDGKRAIVSFDNEIRNWRDINFKISAILKNIDFVRKAQLNGGYRGDQLAGTVGAKLGGFSSQVKTLDFVDCGYKLHLEEKTANIQCGPQTVSLALVDHREFPNKALFRLYPTIDLKISNLSYENGVQADWDLRLLLNHLNILNLDIDAIGSFASLKQTDTSKPQLHYSADTEVKFQVSEFKKLETILAKTPFAIPAPFNVMNGQVNLAASGDINEERGRVPFRLQTRLASKYQKLNTTLGGDFTLQKNEHEKIVPALSLNFALEDVLLSVPRVDLTSLPPQLLPDARFKKGLQNDVVAKKTNSQFQISTLVSTIRPGGLRLQTNLSTAPIPITLRYSLKPKNPLAMQRNLRPTGAVTSDAENGSETESQGHVYVGRAPISLKQTDLGFLKKLQRNAVIDHFDIIILPDGTEKIDGKLIVNNPDAEIRILFLGTMEQPVVHLESDPPADQDQIMAALLLGRPLYDVEQDEAEVGAQAKTALNDTALTIVQMLLLANTPINSLNYDSESGRVVASIGIANGTSVQVGKGNDTAGTEIGVRRRLARNVYLSTYVEDTGSTNEKLVNAFIEWVRRF
jgi:hypothetical protein